MSFTKSAVQGTHAEVNWKTCHKCLIPRECISVAIKENDSLRNSVVSVSRCRPPLTTRAYGDGAGCCPQVNPLPPNPPAKLPSFALRRHFWYFRLQMNIPQPFKDHILHASQAVLILWVYILGSVIRNGAQGNAWAWGQTGATKRWTKGIANEAERGKVCCQWAGGPGMRPCQGELLGGT